MAFELKYDGFRATADTVNGRMLSKRGNRMHRFEVLLGSLPVAPISPPSMRYAHGVLSRYTVLPWEDAGEYHTLCLPRS